jgi:hypothetical protein
MKEVEALYKQMDKDEKFPAKANLVNRYKKDIPSLMDATR